MDVSGKIAQANGRLKSSRVRAQIQQIGDKLYLQATLPPKPDSTKVKPYQQRIPLGIGAHPRGVQLAEAEARKVGALLDCNEFDWMPYLKDWGKIPQYTRDWVAKFELTHKGTVSETTWKTEYQQVFKALPLDKPLTPEVILKVIEKTSPNTRNRKRYCTTLAKLAEFAGIELNIKQLKGNYSYTEVDPRSLPSDEHIAEVFYTIPNLQWRHVYGLLATFGLRNHEAFFLNIEPLQEGKFWVELKQGKTGGRLIWACYPEWIDEFGLRSGQLPAVTGRNHADYGNRVTHQFDRYNVPFTPYSLRHCWAVRTLEFGLDISLAAKQMGHSVKVHTETYHRWITMDVHQRAFDALMLRSNRPIPPRIASASPETVEPKPLRSDSDDIDKSIGLHEDSSPSSAF